MTRVALLRVSGIQPVVGFLRRGGVPVDRLLERLRIPAGALAEPEASIPTYLGIRLLKEAARAEGEETLGALIGAATRLEHLGVFGRRLLQSVTLYDLIRTAQRMLPSYHTGEWFWLEDARPTRVFRQRFTVALDDWYQQASQYSLLIAVALLRTVGGPGYRPTVYVKRGVPRTIREVSLLRDAELVFDQPTSGVSVPSALLHLPCTILRGAPDGGDVDMPSWSESRPATDFAAALRQWMTRVLRTDAVRIAVLSEAIGTTPRTLQRRLADAGTTYARVLAQARFDLATRLLACDDLPIRDVAHEAGYRDPAHLTRAFQRWSGTTPSRFRYLQRAFEARPNPDSLAASTP